MRPSVLIGVHAVAPLSLGGATYVLFRSRTIHGLAALDALGLGPVLDGLRCAVAPARPALPDVVLFTLPDALWIYALVWALVSLHATRALRLLWLGAGLTLGAGLELAQLAGVVGGTFDSLDLGLSLAAAALGWCVAERSHLTSRGA